MAPRSPLSSDQWRTMARSSTGSPGASRSSTASSPTPATRARASRRPLRDRSRSSSAPTLASSSSPSVGSSSAHSHGHPSTDASVSAKSAFRRAFSSARAAPLMGPGNQRDTVAASPKRSRKRPFAVIRRAAGAVPAPGAPAASRAPRRAPRTARPTGASPRPAPAARRTCRRPAACAPRPPSPIVHLPPRRPVSPGHIGNRHARHQALGQVTSVKVVENAGMDWQPSVMRRRLLQ